MEIIRHEKLEELLDAACHWRLKRETFKRMDKSIHLGTRYSALGSPAQDVRNAAKVFWKIVAELKPELL